MRESIEVNEIDTRFEHTRRRDPQAERSLLSSIAQGDIQDPLEVIECKTDGSYILLNGFKRFRCAKKLEIGIVPVTCIADNVVEGVLSFLRRDQSPGLSTMEQATLLQELHSRYSLSIADIASRFGCSPSWVSVRLSMLEDLSDFVRGKIMAGAFPARAYMYDLRHFTRVKKIARHRIDEFVAAVSGKGLSTRQIFILSRAYFDGGQAFERLVREGDVHKALRIITTDTMSKPTSGQNDRQRVISDLRTLVAIIKRITAYDDATVIADSAALHDINFWSHRILLDLQKFTLFLRRLYDRSRPADSRDSALSTRREPQSDSQAASH